MSSINSTAQAGASQDPGELFRNAANKNNVNEMFTLYRTHGKKPEFDIKAAGPTSGKTAAHRAAMKGHASALRLLHSLGDTFEKKDNEGCTPEQLTSDPKCKQVFALAALGRKAMAAAINVFPIPIYPDKLPDAGVGNQFLVFRMKKTALADKGLRFMDDIQVTLVKEATETTAKCNKQAVFMWFNQEVLRIGNLVDNYYTLEQAKACGQKGGADGDRCEVAFTYLVSIAKTEFLVEQIEVNEGGRKNHNFLVLNRCEGALTAQGLSEALIIDSLASQTFFFENFDQISHPLIKDGLFPKWFLHPPCTNKPISTPPPGWAPVSTLAKLNAEYTKWLELGGRKLEELLNDAPPLDKS